MKATKQFKHVLLMQKTTSIRNATPNNNVNGEQNTTV